MIPGDNSKLDPPRLVENDVLHSVYLPFSAATLSRHFAPVGGGSAHDAEDYLRYYRDSANRYAKFLAEVPNLRSLPLSTLRLPCQIEKDERFWTAACWLEIFYCEERIRVLSALMRRCFGDRPPLKRLRSWAECFDGDLFLYFEAHLPSPNGYKRWLRQNLFGRNLIPYVLRVASRDGSRDFEGATHVDALLLNPRNGFAVLVEAKVLSDISCQVSFDVARNQIARTVDVMLEQNPLLAPPLCNRDPEETLFVFQSPAIFKANPHARLYGWLLENYRSSPSAIVRDLPHRGDLDWASISSRIGWLTWEDCEATLPGSCRWLAQEGAVPAVQMELSETAAIRAPLQVLPYTLNASLDKVQLKSLIADFESAAKRDVDRSLSQKIRAELLRSDQPYISLGTLRQLAKWCNTNNPVYWDGMDVARKISQLLFGCVVDRHKLGV
jgi:hypothetical protein